MLPLETLAIERVGIVVASAKLDAVKARPLNPTVTVMPCRAASASGKAALYATLPMTLCTNWVRQCTVDGLTMDAAEKSETENVLAR